MEKTLKVKFKIGEIEFEAEGSADEVEKERLEFVQVLLPAAVDAMVRTRGSEMGQVAPVLPHEEMQLLPETSEIQESEGKEDFSRTSLASYIKKQGVLSEQDFVLFSAYFYEKKDGVKEFNADSIKQYYAEARRTLYSNNSMLLIGLIKKGYIMEVPAQEDKTGKFYILTSEGLQYVENYVPKENSIEKKVKKSRKSSTKANSQYSTLTADDLNLRNYPEVKDQKSSKAQIVLAMYIVTNEQKGEWFSVLDIEYLLTYIFEIHWTSDMIRGVFKDHKSWFATIQDESNKKAYKYKLLSKAKDFAETIIQEQK